ncbi:hypothetical protein SDC9_166960 [bioreactor metagenome]|uniref:Uncharacterized protein n=1 Tax=bioreactor metagenome TaxID=1076179 RepID=A0A645G1A7_9ZZZZ
MLVPLADVLEHIHGGPLFALGVIKFDTRGLGRILEVVVVGKQPQCGINECCQPLGLALNKA